MTTPDAAAEYPAGRAGTGGQLNPGNGAAPGDVNLGNVNLGNVNQGDANPGEPASPAVPAGPGEPAKPAPVTSPLPEQSREDTDAAWGEYTRRDDDHLYQDRPPHWRDY